MTKSLKYSRTFKTTFLLDKQLNFHLNVYINYEYFTFIKRTSI